MPVSSEDAERAFLGSMLLNRSVAEDAAAYVRVEDFYYSKHRLIFAAAYSIIQAGGGCDIVTVCEKLGNNILEAGGHAYVAGLIEEAPVTANWQEYAKIIKNARALRDIEAAAYEVYESAKGGAAPAIDLASFAFNSFSRITETVSGATESALGVSCRGVAEAILSTLAGNHVVAPGEVPVPTGFPRLDSILDGGLRPGDLCIVAARPGVGKTAMALNIASHVSISSGIPSVFFSLEMTSQSLYRRLLNSVSGVDGKRISRGEIYPDDRERVPAAIEAIARAPLFIDDFSGNMTGDILAKARRVFRKNSTNGVGIIFVDYLQLICPDFSKRAENRVNEVATMTRALKGCAKQLGVPIVVLSQLSRALEHRENHRPRLADLRDSGAIEQDADIVLFLSRLSETDQRDVLLDVAKQRNGPVGEIPMNFRGDTTTFTEKTS